MNFLLFPPVALLIYSAIGVLFYLFGKKMSPKEDVNNEMKRSLYGSGEAGPTEIGIPGYKPFLLIALFFAILHLGILVVGMSNLSTVSAVYLIALILGLIALVLG